MAAGPILNAAAVQALERGQTIRITYDSGFTHRLRLESPGDDEPHKALQGVVDVATLVRELVRRPVDVTAARDVDRAERMLRETEMKHGAARAWTDESASLRWLLR